MGLNRRKFIVSATLTTAGLLLYRYPAIASSSWMQLGKPALTLSHFPDRMHALVWRNWFLVPVERLAEVSGASTKDILKLGADMGLPTPQSIAPDQQLRSYITIIRRNWHLLPTKQLLALLDWTPEKLEFTLKEDDFLYVKLGNLKPTCSPIRYQSNTHVQKKTAWIKQVIKEEFSGAFPKQEQSLFHFVEELSKAPKMKSAPISGFSPRFGYAYFALFGDPLLDSEIDPYPNGYLDQMKLSGMDSTWLHIVLSKLTPFPWDPAMSLHWEQRLENLKKLVERAKRHGIGIYLYLNEPRSLPLTFFEKYPDLKGVTRGDQAALCTSHPDVQQYIVDSLAMIAEKVPGLAGFFSITASENPTNCWSHYQGANCPRCGSRGAAVVISELNNLYMQGIQQGFSTLKKESTGPLSAEMPQLIAWDWGWANDWAEGIIPHLPKESALMSVSEWEIGIERGGVRNTIGEYSISAVGPGPRAMRHWEIARRNGLKTIAKIQAGNTWEIAAVPYIPALENVAQHAANLRHAGVNGLMLGWTLGGYPSPNLEVVAAIGSNKDLTPLQAMELVAQRRYGKAADAVVQAWRQFSVAFSEFPFGSGLYTAPYQVGPANLLWESPTDYPATMVGIPYDDVKAWTGNYPVPIYIGQLNKVTEGFNKGLDQLKGEITKLRLNRSERIALEGECAVAETVAIHYSSVVNQVRFISIRNELVMGKEEGRQELIDELEHILRGEIDLSKRMNELQNAHSTLGYEASNHYFYVPIDLVEKVLNCRDLLDRWLPELGKA